MVYLEELGTQSFGLGLFLILLCSLRRPTVSFVCFFFFFKHLPPLLPSQFYEAQIFKNEESGKLLTYRLVGPLYSTVSRFQLWSS